MKMGDRRAMNRKQQVLFLLTTSLFWFAMYTYPVLLSTHVTEGLGGTPAMAGLVVGSYGFTQMILRIPVGYLSDRLRRRRPFLVLGAACTCVAALGLFFASSPQTALLARGMAGVAASTWVCFTVLFGSSQPAALRHQAMGTLSATMYASQLIATLLGGALARGYGVRVSFILAAAAGLIAVLCATRVREVPVESAPVTVQAIGRVLQDRLLLYCAFLSILMQMVSWSTLYGFSPSWAEQALGADAAQLGLLSTVHLIPTILFSRIGVSRIVPKLGEKVTIAVGFACIAGSCFGIAHTTAFWQMLCFQALCGIGTGCAAPLLLSLCNRNVTPAHQGIAMGAYQSLYGIGMFIGPMLAGWLVQAIAPSADGLLIPGYRAVFFAATGLAVVGAVAVAWLPLRKPAK